MRRWLTSVLLLVFCAGLVLPFMQNQPLLTPACCRTGGKHHCNGNMGASEETSGLAGFKSAPATCPYGHSTALTSEQSALAVTRHQIGIFVLSSETVLLRKSRLYSNLCDDARKRGPPAA